MNCKPGDMAMIMRSSAGNEGKVVTCIEFLGDLYNGRIPAAAKDFWLVDTELRCATLDGSPGNSYSPYARDSVLKPLRPDDSLDEMLLIAGPPQRGREKI